MTDDLSDVTAMDAGTAQTFKKSWAGHSEAFSASYYQKMLVS
jgi:hypothetical protein